MFTQTRGEEKRRALCVACSILLHVFVFFTLASGFDESVVVGPKQPMTVTFISNVRPAPLAVSETQKIVPSRPSHMRVSQKGKEGISEFVGPSKPILVPVVQKGSGETLEFIGPPTPLAKKTESLASVSVKKIDWAAVQEAVSDSGEGVSFEKRGYKTKGSMLFPRDLYVRECVEKITRTGNLSNRAKQDGRVVVHVAILPNGEVSLVQAEGAEELSSALVLSAEEVVRSSSPFPEFPQVLAEKTKLVSFTVPINFVSNR